jgi:hypothetical protein
VVLKLDVQESGEKKETLENPGAQRILADLGGARSGVPYFAFLDEAGKKIADSNALPGGRNIGYPARPDEIAAFRGLLKHTAPRISDDQLDRLTRHLEQSVAH